MKSWIGFLAMAVVLTLCFGGTEAQARRNRRGGYTSSAAVSSAAMPTDLDASLQAVAQARADVMAKMDRMDHNIHTYSAAPTWTGRRSQGRTVLEGIGCSSVQDPKQCATCVCGSVVVADAHAFGHGKCFRVRFFR